MDGYKWKDIFSVGLPGLYLDCCDLKEEQQMTSARHYVAEAMILLDNHDILDEYYVRKVICRNIFLVHLLIVVMTILFMSWSWVLKGSLAFECADIVKIVLSLIYCISNAWMFYRLWNRFTKRYIQVQLFCFQTLVDGKKIN